MEAIVLRIFPWRLLAALVLLPALAFAQDGTDDWFKKPPKVRAVFPPHGIESGGSIWRTRASLSSIVYTSGNMEGGGTRLGVETTRRDSQTLDTMRVIGLMDLEEDYHGFGTAVDPVDDGDRTLFEFRREWVGASPLPGESWIPFVQGSYQLDDMYEWERRFAMSAGVGRLITADRDERFMVRFGLGFRNDGGENDQFDTGASSLAYQTTNDNDRQGEFLMALDWDKVTEGGGRWDAYLSYFHNTYDGGDSRSLGGVSYENGLGSSAWSWLVGADLFREDEPGGAPGSRLETNDSAFYAGLSRRF